MGALQREGEIVIGVKFDVPPFGFPGPGEGEVQGFFDVEVGRAEALGVRPRFVEAVSEDRIPLLQAGDVDLVLSTMTITGDGRAGQDQQPASSVASKADDCGTR